MSIKQIFMAIMVAAIWGLNFIAIKLALNEVPPFLLITLRFIGTVFPFIIFFPKPQIPLQQLLWFTLFQWILHFGLLFSGIYAGVNAGASSLISQSQIIFTILLSFMFFGFRPKIHQILGIVISFTGLILFCLQGDCNTNLIGFILIIGAAMAVSVANVLFRQFAHVNIVSVVVWSSAYAIIPMYVISCALEGWDALPQAVVDVTWMGLASIAYTAIVSTFIGIVTWGKLMNQCEPSKVVPFTLLVPVVGMSAGYFFLEETLSITDLAASSIIIAGLIINQLPIRKSAKIIKIDQQPEKLAKEAA